MRQLQKLATERSSAKAGSSETPPPPSSSGQRIQIVIADSSRIHTHLLAEALGRDPILSVVAATRSAEVLQFATAHGPCIVILSASFDDEPMRGLEIIRELRTVSPEARCILLLDSDKREAILEAFYAGARGIFNRHESLENLCRCVRQVHEGQVWANAEQMRFAVEALATSPRVHAISAGGMELLSKREREVVRCLAEGLTNNEIGERLGLSRHTIKNYLFRVFDKLGVSNRMELLYLTLHESFPQHHGAEEGGALQLSVLERQAEQGSTAAQFDLACIFQVGNGVTQDPVSAYMWLLVAENTNHSTKDAILAAKRKLAETLATDQILVAQQRALQKIEQRALADEHTKNHAAPHSAG